MDDLSQFREALQAYDFDRIYSMLQGNSEILIKAYDSPSMNDKMTSMCRHLINRRELINREIFSRFSSLNRSDSILSKAIEFNAIELFSILNKYCIAVVERSSPHEGIPKAVDKCPNSRMIYECFTNNLIDLRFPHDYKFLERNEIDMNLAMIPYYLVDSLMPHVHFDSILHRGYRVDVPLCTNTVQQHFLDRALYYCNVHVAKECLKLGIRPSKQPESHQMQRLIVFYTDPNYEFHRNDYPILPMDIQEEISTVMHLTIRKTLINVLPSELQDRIFDYLIELPN